MKVEEKSDSDIESNFDLEETVRYLLLLIVTDSISINDFVLDIFCTKNTVKYYFDKLICVRRRRIQSTVSQEKRKRWFCIPFCSNSLDILNYFSSSNTNL